MLSRLTLLFLVALLALPACDDENEPTPTPGDPSGGCDNLDDQGNCLDEAE